MDPATQLFIVLLVCGTLLVFAEIFVPGGILGLIGSFALFGAVFLAFHAYGAGAGFWVSVGVVAYAVGFTVQWLRLMPKTRLGKRITLSRDGKAFKAHDEALEHPLIGCRGEAVSSLRPAGIALIDGRRLDVVADGQYIEKGRPVVVREASAGRIVVAEIEESAE